MDRVKRRKEIDSNKSRYFLFNKIKDFNMILINLYRKAMITRDKDGKFCDRLRFEYNKMSVSSVQRQ